MLAQGSRSQLNETLGWRMREPSLIALKVVYCAINVVGIYRWLLHWVRREAGS